MNGPEPAERKPLLFLWSVLAAPPLAWLAVFALLELLTNHACGHVPIGRLLVVGLAGLAVSLAAGVAARVRLARMPDAASHRQAAEGPPEAAHRSRFMLQMAIGLGAMFLLLIAVSTAPVLWLSACPT
jgi:hypothetical protein